MRHCVTRFRFVKFLILAFAASSPSFAECSSNAVIAPSGTRTVELTAATIESFTIFVDQPGLLAIEVVAPADALAKAWIAAAPSGCGEGAAALWRTVIDSAARTVLQIEMPGAVTLHLGSTSYRERQSMAVDLFSYFLPASDALPIPLMSKDGDGGGEGGGDGDGDGSEEADREIPPVAPPIGSGVAPTTLRAALRWCEGRGDGERGPFCAPALGEAAGGTLSPRAGDRRDHYGMTLAAPAFVVVAAAAERDVYLALTDVAGVSWLRRVMRARESPSVTRLLLPAGQYDLRIEAADDEEISYQLAVETSPIR